MNDESDSNMTNVDDSENYNECNRQFSPNLNYLPYFF